MKRSRIICSIFTVAYILISVFLVLILGKSTLTLKSSIGVNVKVIYIVIFALSTGLYIYVKNRLINKTKSQMLINIYCYLFLAVVLFVSRIIMAYLLKDTNVQELVPSFSCGLGSYLNYGLGKILQNQFYANVIINTILTFASCVLIKRIILNITSNDTMGTLASVIYILLPQSLIYLGEYIKGGYNSLVILIAFTVLLKIIDLVKQFKNRKINYIVYSVILGIIESIDIILGGSYVFWISITVGTACIATYIDVTHIRIKNNLKSKLSFNLKRIVERIEKINISKLIYVSIISLSISGITCLIYSCVTSVNNYDMVNLANNLTKILIHSRNYYIVLIIFTLVFELLGFILKRKTDEKMFLTKLGFMSSIGILAFSVNHIYISNLFDTMLALMVIINICNICYNREEKVRLLNEKN